MSGVQQPVTMEHTEYVPIEEINSLQKEIMIYIIQWVHEKKIPVPRQEILFEMRNRNRKQFDIENSLDSLLKKGYVRRAYTNSNKTYYVQMRTLPS